MNKKEYDDYRKAKKFGRITSDQIALQNKFVDLEYIDPKKIKLVDGSMK